MHKCVDTSKKNAELNISKKTDMSSVKYLWTSQTTIKM